MEAKILSAMDWEIKYHQPTDHNIPKLLKYRLGSYNITNTSPISDDQIVRTVASALERTPIKDDSTRIVILLGKEHIAFTEMVRTVAASKKSMKKKAARIQVLSKAFGTILFYTDLSPRPQIAVEGSEGPPTYKKPVRKLAHKAVLRQEYLVWDELEKKGFGVNLQHFNPGVDKFIDERWGVPKEWRLSAQLLFGGVERTEPKLRELAKEELAHTIKVFPPPYGYTQCYTPTVNTHRVSGCIVEPDEVPNSPSWFGKKKMEHKQTEHRGAAGPSVLY